ncbi:MAG: hypothetical protein WD401_06715 [Thermomicrobiaceae bacterium]
MQQIQEIVNRLFKRFGKLSDTRRAALLGVMFGLLMCVIVLAAVLILGIIADLA